MADLNCESVCVKDELHLTLPSIIGAPKPVLEHKQLVGTVNASNFRTVLPKNVIVDHGRLCPTSLDAPRGQLMEQVRVNRSLRREREQRSDQDQSLLGKSIQDDGKNRYYTQKTLDTMKKNGVLSSNKSRTKAAELRMQQLANTPIYRENIEKSCISSSSCKEDAFQTKQLPVSILFPDPLLPSGEISSSVIDVAGISEQKFLPSRVQPKTPERSIWLHPDIHTDAHQREVEDKLEEELGYHRSKNRWSMVDRNDTYQCKPKVKKDKDGIKEFHDSHAHQVQLQRVQDKNDQLYKGKTDNQLQKILSSLPDEGSSRMSSTSRAEVPIDLPQNLRSHAGGMVGTGRITQTQRERIEQELDGQEYLITGGIHTYVVAPTPCLDKAQQQASEQVSKKNIKKVAKQYTIPPQTHVYVNSVGYSDSLTDRQVVPLKQAFTPKLMQKRVPPNFYKHGI